MKLTRRLLTLYILLTILPLLAVGGLAGYLGRRGIEKQVYDRLAGLNDLKVTELQRWTDSNLDTITLLAQRPLVSYYASVLVEAEMFEQLTPEQQTAYENLRKDHFQPTLNMRDSFQDFLLIRASDGQIILSTIPSMEGLFRENRPFFLDGLKQPSIGEVYYSVREEALAAYVSAPIRNSNGEVVAVIAGHLNLNQMQTIIGNETSISETEDTYLVDAYHYFVTKPRFIDKIPGMKTAFTQGIDNCLAKMDGKGLYKDYRGVDVLGVYSWLQDQQMCVLSEVDLAEVTPDIVRLQTASLGISVAMTVIMLVMGLAFARDILSGIRALEEGTEAIAGGNLAYRIGNIREDEFGVLAQRFNSMAERISEIQARNQVLIEELNHANDTLEEQVEERTSELKAAQVATLNIMEDLVKNQEALTRNTKELERSNAELEQFAYVSSHDLQEPLRMISSYLQLIERRYKGKLDEDADEFINYAVNGADRMKLLINDLLRFSRVGTRGRELVPVPSETILQQVLENLKFAIEESKAEINAADLPEVLADESQFSQLLQNLLSNAIKFRGDAPPRIEIQATPEEGPDGEAMWKFAIHDNGIGIDPQFFERIFIVFQRLHNSEEYPGTGVGLALCKKIVERHGGQIWVESQPAQGSTFFFTLKAVT